MNILILGPQGSGKGTQARLLAQEFGFYYFESGNFLREMAKSNEQLKILLAEGKLVPNEEMSSYVSSHLDSKGIYDNILLEGFPRTVAQYKVFKSWLKDKNVSLDLVIVLKISEKETIRRLSARRMDPKTGKIYNLITDPPPKDLDVSLLVQREDDKEEAIRRRLTWYRSEVEPLIDALKSDAEVYELDGERQINIIFEEISEIVRKHKSGSTKS